MYQAHQYITGTQELRNLSALADVAKNTRDALIAVDSRKRMFKEHRTASNREALHNARVTAAAWHKCLKARHEAYVYAREYGL